MPMAVRGVGTYSVLSQLPLVVGDVDDNQQNTALVIPALVGSYAYRGSQYDVFIMLSVGILGYIMRITGIPMAPLVVTFLVTPLAEASLRRALIISRGDWISALFDSPLSIGLCIVAVAVTVISYRLGALERLQRLEED